MKVKPDVSVLGLTVQALIALCVAESIWLPLGYEAVLTCATDGKHKPKSKHYIGNAIDLRIAGFAGLPDPPHSTVALVVDRLRAALPSYDVVLESDHIHVEWDPIGKT